MDQSLTDLFTEYEKAFSTFHNEAVAKFYADEFMAAGPSGTAVFKNDEAFYKGLEQSGEGYRQMGMHSAQVLGLNETPFGSDYTMVTVHYGAKFHKTGDRLIEFDLSYLVSKVGSEPKIVLFISHQDEQKTLHELGLM